MGGFDPNRRLRAADDRGIRGDDRPVAEENAELDALSEELARMGFPKSVQMKTQPCRGFRRTRPRPRETRSAG